MNAKSLILLASALCFCPSLAAQTLVPFSPFYVYKDSASPLNHFYPTGWMGDCESVKLKDDYIRDARTYDTCIRISYMPVGRGDAPQWAGIYWQNPMNNWGGVEGSFDLTGAERLTFYAKGEKGGELVSKFQVGGISGDFPDSSQMAIYNIRLSQDWKKYEIKIDKTDISCISGGFCLILTLRDNPKGLTIYIDEILYE